MKVGFFPSRGDDGQPVTIFHFLDSAGAVADIMPPILTLSSSDAVVADFERGADGENVVVEVGQALLDQLRQHADCEAEFRALLDSTYDARELRLRFSNFIPEAKRLPWEALIAEGAGFLSIEQNVPILREVSAHGARMPTSITSDEAIRFLAVLGAEGDDGEGEWNAVFTALQGNASELPLQVLLLTSNGRLAEKVTTLGLTWLSAERIPSSADGLAHRIARFRPHIAHFFAHGFAGAQGGLVVETPNNAFGGQPIVLDAASLIPALSDTVWAIVFNACSLAGLGAAPVLSQGAMSLCEDMVESGVPFVVGMRGEVEANRVRLFGRGFHRRLLMEISHLRQQGGGELRLGACFTAGCRATLDGHGGNPAEVAGRINAWAVPIMNVSMEAFSIDILPGRDETEDLSHVLTEAEVSSPDRQELLGELGTLRELLRDMRDGLEQSVRQDINDRINQLLSALTSG